MPVSYIETGILSEDSNGINDTQANNVDSRKMPVVLDMEKRSHEYLRG